MRYGKKNKQTRLGLLKFVVINLDDLFNLGSLAGSSTKVVEFSTSNFTLTDNLNSVNLWRVNRERSFNADTKGQTSYGKGFANATVALSDNDAFKSL